MNSKHTPLLYTLIITLTVTACHPRQKVDDYTDRDLLVVTLETENQPDIEKITMVSDDGKRKDSLLKKDITGQRSFKLRYPQPGDGTYTLCVYTSTDTLCTEPHYVGNGFRPKLRLKEKKFEVLEWF